MSGTLTPKTWLGQNHTDRRQGTYTKVRSQIDAKLATLNVGLVIVYHCKWLIPITNNERSWQ